jgi:hypothetical protein
VSGRAGEEEEAAAHPCRRGKLPLGRPPPSHAAAPASGRERGKEREREGRRLEAEVRRRVAAALESGEDWGLGAERDEDMLGG